ncbi:insecticidal toxin [Pseudomonas sp. IT-347P]|uniref:TcdA/TcdB pore-forming domain-containing protein n=1 Tax=Pseudomonas sp. IT-347P TaxID=3026458 RepID=UPI0039DF8AEF
MKNIETLDNNFVNFAQLLKLADLEQALSAHKNSVQYDALLRYYAGCVAATDAQQLLEPLRLLRQTLEQLPDTRRVRRDLEPVEAGTADLSRIHDRIEGFESRVQSSLALIRTEPTAVPKTMHFVWLGGGVGAIQRDYLNVWKQVLAEHGYTLNLWYDSDALLAYQTNKLIVESAKADALHKVAGQTISEDALATLYEERAIVLKQQMFAHLNAAVANGESADDARIDLLTRAYGQDRAELQALRERNLSSVQAIAGANLQLRDLDGAVAPLQLQDIYEQEMRLRGNLAAASDVVRAEVLYRESGSYADVDNLPPLVKNLAGIDLDGLGVDARLGILQLLLNHNPEWMPGRPLSSSYFEQIPVEHREALLAFAESRPALSQVFQAPTDRMTRPFVLRAVAEGSSLTNAFLMAHAGSATLQAFIERVRFNYELVDSLHRSAARGAIALTDVEALMPLALAHLEKTYGPLQQLSDREEIFAGFLAKAAVTYFSDGIRRQSEGTIYLTGPGALRDAMGDYAKAHLTPEHADRIFTEAAIARYASVNRATEEELDHSWKDNGTDPFQWVEDEQARWQQGQYQAHYQGDIAQLLKGSTLMFEQGWPVIEEREVLLTDVLQRLVDGLGEPFVDAMRRGHDGAITFEKPLPLTFEDRQSIRLQPARMIAPASLSDARVQSLGLDEVLSAMGHGELDLVQVSPQQRLALGVLLGIDSLDTQSFIKHVGELDNLANSLRDLGASGRYAAIERQLYRTAATAFKQALADTAGELAGVEDNTLSLKKNAMKTAMTMQQWGRQVAQIEKTAILEHQLQVNERVGQVLGQFHNQGSVQSVPQDLLLDSHGEAIGGRCLPLALMMSAAMTQGGKANALLRERFFMAVAAPKQPDSISFIWALEQLQDTQLSEVGTFLDRANLAQVTAHLEQHAGTRTLLLNTDNHSMLVAKTVEGERVIYHFYDPNFGLFGFENAASFQAALQDFFLSLSMARYYAAYGTEARPTFDVVHLHGERVAALTLPGEFNVAMLLTDDPLPEQPAQTLRQRLNSAHGRSLVENAHLGASLLGLDSHWWAQQIAHTTSALQELHPSATPLVPLFETLQVTAEGKYRIHLIDPSNPEQTIEVLSEDHRLLRIKNHLSELFTTLARKPRPVIGVPDPTEVASVHTLNAGFSIQALMNALRDREGEGRTLTTAVRLHAYVNYAQLVHGNIVDAVGLVRLVRTALNEEKLIARTSGPLVAEALGHVANEGVGALLGLANVGFDVYQLATAKDGVERAQFGTQLAFDSASLALTAAGIGAAATGAATAAAVLGGAGVILGGLAVGVAALAQGFAGIARDAQAVGDFFADLVEAHHRLGYRFDTSVGAWVPRPALIVKSIDLMAGQMLLDSPKLYPLRDHFGVPDYDPDYDRAINLRQHLSLPGQTTFAPLAGQVIVLPCTPLTCYGYEYKALPFANERHDRGFDIARRLEKRQANGQWLFLFSFYSFPSEYILHRLFPDYRETVIDIQLDKIERTLVVPTVPAAWHNKVAYKITSAGASCTLLLNPGVGIELQSPAHLASRWVLQAGWAHESDIRIERFGDLHIGDVPVRLSGKGRHALLIRTADHQLFSVDHVKLQLDIVEQSAPVGLDEQALLLHYKDLAREHRLALPYTPVHEWPIPFESPQQPRQTTAWYDAREERFLYLRNDRDEAAEDAQLALVTGGYAYFYVADSFDIWQVDAISGLIRSRYRLLLTEGTNTIGAMTTDASGVIHFEQTVTGPQGPRTFSYLLHQGQLQLCSVTHDLRTDLQEKVFLSETLGDWSTLLGHYTLLHPFAERDGVITADWQPAAYVAVCWKYSQSRRDMVWVRSRDRLLIHPLPQPRHARGWNDSIKNMTDLVLVSLADEHDLFVIYNRLDQTLCRLQRTGVRGRSQWLHRWIEPEQLAQVVAVANGYLVLDEAGRFFNLTPQGELQLGGVGQRWLKDRAQWWLALEPIAKRYSINRFAIVGLRNATDDGNLNAWFVNERLLLCDLGHNREVRLLGMTPDHQAVWLFDLSSGAILSQRFIDPPELERAFGAGSKLLHREVLPEPEQEWAGWRFADVVADGAGLQGTTVEGVLLKLRYREAEVVGGVNHQWVAAQDKPLVASLEKLLDAYDHDEFVQVASASNSVRWYNARHSRLLTISGEALPKDFSLLGTRQQAQVLLHERREGRVCVYPGMHSIGQVDYLQRTAQVLAVEKQGTMEDLLPLIPDDVDTLLLRLGQGHATCHLSKAVWQKLDSIIVDCRHALGEMPSIPGKLICDFDAPEKLLFEIVQDSLLVVDPDTEHCLIFRDVGSADPALRGDVFLALKGQQSHAVSAVVARLRIGNVRSAGVTLQTLMEEPAAAG